MLHVVGAASPATSSQKLNHKEQGARDKDEFVPPPRETEMGSAEGEAIAAPDAGGAGGSRAHQGGDAGCAMQSLPRVCGKGSYGAGTAGSSGIRHARRRERQLDSVCLIGQGSAALVYLVRCKETGKMSALKVSDPAKEALLLPRERERETAPTYFAKCVSYK